ncbi:hypothetical protein ACFC96_44015 [Streptomyces sp. NPDC055955]|uniref:hypothetical protein n=1 Tax=Streptomyces sp. NPDC055955 TaxID=3345665 RepID=UPI0035DF542A
MLLGHTDLVSRLGTERISQLCDPSGFLDSAIGMTHTVLAGHGGVGRAARC